MGRLNLLSSIQTLPRDLRLLWVSLFLWTFGLGIYNYVWSIYLTELHANPEQVGLVSSIGFIAAALSMIPGGVLANKFELKALLIAGWVMSMPPPIMFYYAGNWPDVIPGLVLLQLSAFNLPAMNAIIGELGDKRKIASAFGTVYSAAPMGLVLSPIAGGLLLNLMRIRDLFWVSFIFWTISTIILLPLKRQPPRESDSNAPLLEFPKSRQQLTILVFLSGATVAYSITSPSFLPLYLHNQLGLTSSQVQLFGAVQSFSSAVFTILLGRWASTRSQGRTIAKGLLLVAGGAAGIGLAGSPFMVLPMVFLFGGARAPSPVAYSILSDVRHGQSRGGRFGFYLTFEQLGFVVGSYIGGILYTLNPVSIFGATSTLFLVLAGLSWLRIRGLQPTATPLTDMS